MAREFMILFWAHFACFQYTSEFPLRNLLESPRSLGYRSPCETKQMPDGSDSDIKRASNGEISDPP